MFGVLIIINLSVWGNLLYYRVYGTILPVQFITLYRNFNGLGGSIVAIIKWQDILFFVPTIVIFFLYYSKIKRQLQIAGNRIRLVCLLIILILSSAMVFADKMKNQDSSVMTSGNNSIFYYKQVEGTYRYGFIACWLWQLENYKARTELSALGTEKIKKWLALNHNTVFSNPQVFSTNKNIILIVVESLESFPISCKINNEEITPNLNNILKSEQCFYASRILPQVKDGRSIDAQLILNTGLLPLNFGPIVNSYLFNRYYSLPDELKKKSYFSATFAGLDPAFWNQKAVCKAFGYDSLFSIDRFRKDDLFGLGLSDSTFFVQSAEMIRHLPEPFFLQMLTLSSHMPYKIPSGKICINIPTDIPGEISDYLKSINYMDRTIGNFIQLLKNFGLFDKTILIITGDHNALSKKEYDIFSNNKYVNSSEWESGFIPLIIVNSPVNDSYMNVAGQIDIYPTLLEMLGLTDNIFTGLGQSLLCNKKPGFAVSPFLKIVGDTMNIPNEEIQHRISAWEISDMIIKTDYFRNKK